MKKLILVVTVLVAFSFASCKKDHTCICKSGTLQVEEDNYLAKKKQAKDHCNAMEESYRNKGADVTCELQ